MNLTFDPTVNVADLASLAVALVALVLSLIALHRSDRTSSAGTLVGVYDSISAAWDRFLAANSVAKQNFELAELLNRIEVACSMSLSQGIHGAAKELLDEYVESSMLAIAGEEGAAEAVRRMRERPTTFKYIQLFIRNRKRRARMGEIVTLFDASANDSLGAQGTSGKIH